MATHAPSVSEGQYGLMAAVWLVLIAMFAALLVTSRAHRAEAPVPASALEPLPMHVEMGDLPKTREPISAVFFEGDSAALTERGSRWLERFAAHSARMKAGKQLRLDILPPTRSADVTAARIAAVAATLAATGADMDRVEIGTHRAGEGAHFGLASGRQEGGR